MSEKKSYKVSNIYSVEGNKLITKNRTCPKCGRGVFMAKHKDRWTCGKCGYTEFLKTTS